MFEEYSYCTEFMVVNLVLVVHVLLSEVRDLFKESIRGW